MPSCKISGAIRDCHPSSSSRCAVWWSATPAMGSSTRRKIAASSFTPSFISVSTPKASGRKSDACSAWVEWENRTCRGTPSSGQFPRPAFTRRFPCGRRGSRLSAAQPPPRFSAQDFRGRLRTRAGDRVHGRARPFPFPAIPSPLRCFRRRCSWPDTLARVCRERQGDEKVWNSRAIRLALLPSIAPPPFHVAENHQDATPPARRTPLPSPVRNLRDPASAARRQWRRR